MSESSNPGMVRKSKRLNIKSKGKETGTDFNTFQNHLSTLKQMENTYFKTEEWALDFMKFAAENGSKGAATCMKYYIKECDTALNCEYFKKNKDNRNIKKIVKRMKDFQDYVNKQSMFFQMFVK